jgi:tetratricopeptide (TPR) repeat protein
MADQAGADIVKDPAAALVLAAWQESDHARRRDLLQGMPVPGAIALRSRYRHLLDPQAPAGPWNPDWSPDRWNTVLRLETEGDGAVTRNDVAAARVAFTALAELGPSDSSHVVAVHVHVGFADIALASDDGQAATSEYEAALALARAHHYRFGQLRALVGLGYLTLMFHTGASALERFTDAAAIANAIDDPVYHGNAALGAAECHERLGNLDQAIKQATDAYHDFARFGAEIGRGNAAQRLGAMLHRNGQPAQAKVWLEQASAAFAEAGNPMGMTNALSCLGDLLLDEGDLDGAERAYREDLRIAEKVPLPRSRAHALQDLGRVARCRGEFETAASLFTRSLAAYTELDDMLGMSYAYDKLARTYADLGQAADVMDIRMESIYAVEEFRATHRDERSQREYRDRFAGVYRAALKAATEYNATGAFAVVADCLAGRRLAGLFAESATQAAGTGELTLLQDLVVRADQRLVENRRLSDRRERVIRMLGAISIKHGLAPAAETSLDDLLATVYLPPTSEGDSLLAALPGGCQVLVTLIDPADPYVLRWLWRDPNGAALIGSAQLSGESVALLRVLTQNSDERAALRVTDLAPLADLFPAALRAEFGAATGSRLILIPAGDLWFVPWGAIPVTGSRVLGEVASYVICPSVTVQRQLAGRQPVSTGQPPRHVDLWRSPLVSHHEFTRLRQDPGWRVTVLQDPGQAKDRLRSGSATMVVTGHGRPLPGPGHYLELDAGRWLLPVDLIGARSPGRLVMIACWGGAIPGQQASDPLSMATLALAAGSSEVLATVGELADQRRRPTSTGCWRTSRQARFPTHCMRRRRGRCVTLRSIPGRFITGLRWCRSARSASATTARQARNPRRAGRARTAAVV